MKESHGNRAERTGKGSWLSLEIRIDVAVVGVAPGKGKLRATGDPAVHSASRTFGGSVDGDVKVGLGIIDGYCCTPLQANFDAAAFVHAALWSVDISEPHYNARDHVATMIQRIRQSLEDMVTQTLSQIKVIGVDLDLHLFPRVHNKTREWCIMDIAIVRCKQIICCDIF